jgi:hypothetical protein
MHNPKWHPDEIGLRGGSKLDKELLKRFVDHQDELHRQIDTLTVEGRRKIIEDHDKNK